MIADGARAEVLVRFGSTAAKVLLDVVCFDELGELDDTRSTHARPSPRIAIHEYSAHAA